MYGLVPYNRPIAQDAGDLMKSATESQRAIVIAQIEHWWAIVRPISGSPKNYLGRTRRCIQAIGAIIGSYTNDDGKDKENVTLKQTIVQLWLFCDYSILFAFNNVGEVPYEPNRWAHRSIKFRESKIYGFMLKLSSKPQMK